jgi:hypothetical protein
MNAPCVTLLAFVQKSATRKDRNYFYVVNLGDNIFDIDSSRNVNISRLYRHPRRYTPKKQNQIGFTQGQSF